LNLGFWILDFAPDRALKRKHGALSHPTLLPHIESAWRELAGGLLLENPELPLHEVEQVSRRLIEQWAFDIFSRRPDSGWLTVPSAAVDPLVESLPASAAGVRALVEQAFRRENPPVDMLEAIHQHLLSRRLRRSGGRLSIETSRRRRRAEGIYYTPGYVAAYLADRCLPRGAEGPLPRVLDPACGCGRFLLSAAQRLLRQPEAPSALEIAGALYGSDLDAEAVAVARRILWLELLPRLPAKSDPRQLAEVLEKNILSGNTLTGEVWPGGTRPFDVVLGNPPYRRELGAKPLLDAIADSDLGRRHRAPRMDLWYYFLHRGLELLAPGGRLGFIVGAYWSAGTGADRLIAVLRETVHVEEIFQLDRLQVFPGISGRHMMLVVSKTPPGGPTTIRLPVSGAAADARPFVEGRSPVHTFQKTHGQLFRDRLLDLEPPADRLLDRLARHPALAELGEIRQGIAENPASVTRAADRKHPGRWRVGEGVFTLAPEELAALDLPAAEAGLVRPYHDLCDLGRYDRAARPSLRLIYSTCDTWPRLGDFPVLARHLERFRPLLEARRETRLGVRPWWQLHWPRQARLWESPKLIALQMSRRPALVPASEPAYVSFSVNVFVPRADVAEPLNYFAAILNSRLLWKWFRHHAKRRGAGLEINGHVLARAPIRRIDFGSPQQAAACDSLSALAGRMLALARLARERPDSAALRAIRAEQAAADAEIDRLVYGLYGLAPEEIAMVEQSCGCSENGALD
jgi:adenine-specific DNA-methyltransferase